MLVVLCLLVSSFGLVAQTYVGSAACGRCHADQSRKQASSAHAGALYRASAHPLAPSFPLDRTLLRKPNYRFQFLKPEGDLRININDAEDRMDLPLEWAFGAGRQAVTFVTRVNKDWYVEHYASYYPALRNWAATPGQDAITATSLAEAAGLIYKIADPQSGIAGCFECHSTGPVSFTSEGEAQLQEQGVRCESCHGPGAAHAKDSAHVRPTKPAKLSPAALNEFCGRCHRPPAAANTAIDWSFPWNVRHQPIYLSESQCFKKSRGGLTCLTCHDPHEAAGTAQLADYNQRCLSCHPKSSAKPANCVDCHMPRVSPQPPLRFSNHWIGIYRGGSKLKPVR